MRPVRSKIWHELTFAAILLAACALLMAGAAWARYLTTQTSDLNYVSREAASIYLWSGVDQEAGELIPGESVWETSGDQRTLGFVVSNGVGAEYPQESQLVQIRLVASSALPQGAEVILQIEQDGQQWACQGLPQPIREGTPLYREFGSGWFFTFGAPDAEEMNWTLEGGMVSILSGQLTVTGADLESAALMQLQVTGDMIPQAK